MPDSVTAAPLLRKSMAEVPPIRPSATPRAHEIIACARTWIGTRFQHQARRKGIGCDCLGLVLGIGLELNMPWAKKAARDQECIAYARRPHADQLRKVARRYFDEIEPSRAAVGDVLIMIFASEPTHFGIVSNTAPLSIIHSYAQARKVVEHGLDDVWRKRIVSAFRLRAVSV